MKQENNEQTLFPIAFCFEKDSKH